MEYKENLNVGNRYYDKHPEEICFPFGYGLSYTTFAYQNLSITQNGDVWNVTFDITNTGKVYGTEIAQLYICDPVSTVPKLFSKSPFDGLSHAQQYA